MSKKSVELFYDVVSPYSWFAFEVMCRYQSRWNISLKLRPFFLGGVMNESGNRPPGMVPNKGRYMSKDMHRLRKYFGVPLNIPSDPPKVMFEKGSLNAQRFLTAIDMTMPDKVENVSRELWLRIWSRDEDITTPESLAQAARNAGLSEEDIGSVLAASKEEKVKNQLKKTTSDAMAMGAFGSPMIATEINGEMEFVFGCDRFPILADMIGEKWEGPQPDVSSKL
ncbi:histone-lysine N-methyltransferase SETMAR-like protein [Plakobranchus ocellatus]|uniref:Glutathione S-transferase kappa n=1 Tax=Plakobranchus ocellatus TaxID=259542 RepID=A0AAV4ALV6_9GAST|nr:histone-lysine N-methyltransferase SETMAR-like protein [Plakobranchus ocellatus]